MIQVHFLSWSTLDGINDSSLTYVIQYGLSGFDLDTAGTIDTAFTNSFNLYELEANTAYQYYVTTFCDTNDIGTISFPNTFTTNCAPLTVPLLEEFDDFLPTCWTEAQGKFDDSTTFTSTSSVWTTDGFGNNGFTGSARINIYGSNLDEWLITPPIDLGTNNKHQLEFDLIVTAFSGTGSSGFGSDDTIRLAISLDNGLTWDLANVLETWSTSNTVPNTTQHKIYDLTGYNGIVRFGFYGESTQSNFDFNFYIDNFAVNKCTEYLPIMDTVCVQYTAPTGNDYFESGLFNDTVLGSSCDSIYVLNIVVNSVTQDYVTAIECDTFISVNGEAYTETGLYVDTITNVFQCDSIVETNLSILYLDLSLNQLNNIELLSNESDPSASYQWVDCHDVNTPLDGETNSNFVASELGSYACEITIGNCVQLTECIEITSLDTTTTDTTTTSILSFESSDVSVYPNPSNGIFNIDFNAEVSKDVSLKIINSLGQEIYFQNNLSRKNQLDLFQVDKGIYIVNIKGVKNNVMKRLVIN